MSFLYSDEISKVSTFQYVYVYVDGLYLMNCT